MPCAAACTPKRGHLHHRSQHQLHQLLHRVLHLLRLLPAVTGARSEEGYILDFEKIYEKIAETLEMGGTGGAHAGRHPSRPQDRLVSSASSLASKKRFPQIWLHSSQPLSPRHRESILICPCATPSFACATRASIPSPAAVRRFSTTMCATRIARLKCNTEDWVSVPSHGAPVGKCAPRPHECSAWVNLRAAH